MQLCCCCCCRLRLALPFFFFPLRFAVCLRSTFYPPSSWAQPRRDPLYGQMGIGGVTQACISHGRVYTYVHVHRGTTPHGHVQKKNKNPTCKSFGRESEQAGGSEREPRTAPALPEKQQQPLATQGGDPRHWHGDTGRLCKIHPSPNLAFRVQG